ncbi:MAG: NAD(+)/NADH kinase [Vicinamibacterales bacterium]
MIRRATLIARSKSPESLAAVAEAAEWLSAHGCTPLIEDETAMLASLQERWPRVPHASLARDVDLVIAFGGDGTLLDAANAIAHSEEDVPVIGINLGHLGFLTEVGRAGMAQAFEAMIAGRYRIETRLLIDGRVERGGVVVGKRLALNDVVVTRGAFSRMIEIDVAVDGHFVCHVRADGLIVATATGSTAYNLSAGGPIVHPGVDALVVTPIAPHTLTQRPLVLPASGQIELRPVVEPQSDIVATFDGQFGLPIQLGDVVKLGRASRLMHLMRISPRTHFDMLREKLKWGNA